MHPFVSLFVSAITVTLVQLGGLLGVFFFIGTILSIVQSKTHKGYHAIFGWYGILWTAWIGTPIHELSHVFFAKIFGHNVHKISLFKPNKQTGSLGHIDHSFDSSSLYQRIGNFFVGCAPLIGGSVFLYGLLFFLFPTGKDVITMLPQTLIWPESLHAIINALLFAITSASFLHWQIWLFIYLSLAIASHLAPSKADRKNMWEGLGYIAGALLVVNVIASALSRDVTTLVLGTTKYTQLLVVMFIWALALSILHWLAITVLRIALGK